LKRRGLTTAPQIAVADRALGFWKALGEVWPTAREQRCWVHKTANILNKMPKSLHTKAKRALQAICPRGCPFLEKPAVREPLPSKIK
jgi:putative transposase